MKNFNSNRQNPNSLKIVTHDSLTINYRNLQLFFNFLSMNVPKTFSTIRSKAFRLECS